MAEEEDGFDEDEYDEGAERTAIVNLADLRRGAALAPRDRHLLVRVHGSQLGQVITLSSNAYSIGRSPDSDIWLNDSGMSRRHARLVKSDNAYLVEDLDSANGTFVQGERIKNKKLRDGDNIQLGSGVVFRYSVTDADEEAVLRRLYEASVRDALTGAYNRDHFDERLKAEVSYAKRHKTDVSLVMFDLDHFKRVNDTWGHQAGDAVLMEVSARIQKDLRTEDVFARYGGEEFVVIFRGIAVDGAARVADRLRQVIGAAPVDYDGKPIPVTASLGVASLACIEDLTSEALIGAADRRLYAAKHAGRNRVVSEG